MLEYAEKWWIGRNRLIRPITTAKAKQRHVQRAPYVAVYFDNDLPTNVVSFGGQWVSVRFFDYLGRDSLVYSFKELEHGKLFLSQAVCWEYEGSDEKDTVSHMFNFSEGRTVVVTTHDHVQAKTEERTAIAKIDANLETYPCFGKYERLTKRDRISVEDDFVFPA